MPAPGGYSRTQIALHWAVAILIAAQYLLEDGIGTAWEAFVLGKEHAFDPLVLAHVAGGILVLGFAIWRLALRKTRGVPALPENEPSWMKKAAHLTHFLIYALMILLPLSGLIAWFGGVIAAGDAHDLMTKPLLFLIAAHVGAAVLHQFILKTNLMDRMRTARN